MVYCMPALSAGSAGKSSLHCKTPDFPHNNTQRSSPMPLKIAMIGAGSIGFTRRLMRDILAVPELADTTFAMTDISPRNLDMVAQLCRRDIESNKLPAKIEANTDRRGAIAAPDYGISTTPHA